MLTNEWVNYLEGGQVWGHVNQIGFQLVIYHLEFGCILVPLLIVMLSNVKYFIFLGFWKSFGDSQL